MSLTIGVCLGSNADPAAICLVEREERKIEGRPATAEEIVQALLDWQAEELEEESKYRLREPDPRRKRKAPEPMLSIGDTAELHFCVRFLERFHPGTPILDVARRLREVVEGISQRGDHDLTVFLDVTGKGEPALDMFREILPDAYILPVYLTFGDQRSRSRGEITLGKAALVAQLKIYFERERLHLSRGPESENLIKELMDYEVQLEHDANNRPGAFKVGSRDELVTALGLAIHQRQCTTSFG